VDSVDSPAVIGGKKFLLIDTAGIRRKSKTEQGVEVLSVIQSRKAIERCDVAVLLLDGETGLTDQDEKIGGLIEDVGCGVILVVNKWDTQRKKQDFTREVAAGVIRKKMAYLRYAPILFVSAKENQGLDDLGELVLEILEQRRVKVATREITEWIRAQSGIHNPKDAKFYMCHQSGRHPPTFVCHVSDPDKIHFSLRRNLLNGIREKWGYMGNPVRLLFVKGTSTRTKDPTKGRKGDPGKVRMKVKKQRKREIKKRQQG
jgi:GTP-binding protein